MPSPVDIANKALISIGSAPIQNFDDATPTATVVKSIYWDTVNWLLAWYPWSFTKITNELARANITPDPTDGRIGAGWTYAYALPTDAISQPLAVYRFPRVPLAVMKDYAIENALLYSQWDRLFATQQYKVDPNYWSPPFLKAAIACLGAEYLIPISGNSGMYDTLAAKAWGTPTEGYMGGFLGAAMKYDSRFQPSHAIVEQSDPLTDARWM